MKRLFEFLFPVCFHEWEIENKQSIFPFNPFERLPPDTLKLIEKYTLKYNNPIGTQYTIKCKKCGKMKTYYEQVRYSK
jgi:hypothetical protein